MKLAIVVGGWHWPLSFFARMSAQANGADLFVVAHRKPELSIVREEKREILEKAEGPLAELDRILYRQYSSVHGLRLLGWKYMEEPNTIGDWGFFNQWLARHDFRKYDAILNCHDDNWIRRGDLLQQIQLNWSGNRSWLLLSNGRYSSAPRGYARGSFEVWTKELLEQLGGKIDLGPISLTREGKTDSPEGLDALAAWNNTCVPLRDFMLEQEETDTVEYLSPYYRVSPWLIEGERGFLHYQGGAPWSFNEGLKAFPIEEKAIV